MLYLEFNLTNVKRHHGRLEDVDLTEVIQDIHGLNAQLYELESCYGLLSADFYHLYKAGELEQSRDFIQ